MCRQMMKTGRLPRQAAFHALGIGLLMLPMAGLAEGVVYGSIGAGIAQVDYPNSQFFADRGEAAPFARNYNLDADKGNAYGMALDAHLGTLLPVSLGQADATKIELRGFRVSADQTTSRSFNDAGPGMRFGWVELNNSTGFGTPDGSTLNTTIRQDVEYWGADAILLVENGLGSHGSWSIQAGPSFKRFGQDTDATGTIATSVTLNDRLSTDFRGVRLGAAYKREIDSLWSVSLDASLAKYWTKTKYRSHYVDTAFNDLTASMDMKSASLRVDLRLELTRKLSNGLELSGFGQINHLGKVPQVSYGSVPTDPANGTLSLVNNDMTTLVIGIQLSRAF